MEDITIYVVGPDGEKALTIPLGFSMTLMEALKAYDEPIAATCGGMALCASCQVQILDGGIDKTGEKGDDEEAMLESLPQYDENSRLGCQIHISEALDGLRISYMQPVVV